MSEIKKILIDNIKITVRRIERAMIRTLFVFPIKKNKIIFKSYDGNGCSCNPKYIYDYIQEKAPNSLDLVWVLKDPDKYPKMSGTRCIKDKGIRLLLELVTAKVVIINSIPPVTIPRRRGQLVMETWHAGGSYKRVNANRYDVTEYEKWCIKEGAKYISEFISSSEEFTRVTIRKGYLYSGKVLSCGMPRNDQFLYSKIVAETSDCFRKKIGIDNHYYVVLYAPTYRGSLKHRHASNIVFPYLDVIKTIEARTKKKVVILSRMHYLSTDVVAFDDDRIIDVSKEPDMQQILCATNMLITDYSSSIWDYALLGRPCFLYVPDCDYYEQQDRGFLLDINEWPGIVCKDKITLLERIANEDLGSMANKANNHLKQLKSYETGTATEQIYNEIMRFINDTE